MSSRKKIILNVVLFLSCLALAAAAILYNYSYKMCWNCSTADYYSRGKEFVCRDDDSLRQTGLDFLRIAVDRQHVDAQILLGECYLIDIPEGYVHRDSVAFACLNSQLSNNPPLAARLLNQAFQQLNSEATTDHQQLYNFALLIENGIVASAQPQQQAHALYVKAASHGNYAAMSALGRLYHQQSDYAAAKPWLKLAAEAGKAMEPALTLGDYFFYGKDEVINYEKAIYWYRIALKTQKSLLARASEAQRLAAEDVPLARIEMATRQLQKNRMQTPLALHYRIAGNANHYIVHTADHNTSAIGTVTRSDAGATAQIDDSINLALSIATRARTFTSMNEGLDWLLHAYARSRYGSYAKFQFVLAQ